MLQRLVVLVFAMLWLSACQTSEIRDFDSVKAGMDKHQVVERLGSPNSSSRLHGEDRWIYRFYDNGIRYDREVHFKDEIVTFSGAWTPPPEKTAEAADKRHADKEEILQAEEAARDEAKRKNADAFREYEKQSHHQDKVEYMPAFDEVR